MAYHGKVIDTRITIERRGDKFQAVGRDVFESGEVSVLKQNIGPLCDSERDAARFALIATDPVIAVLHATGRLKESERG